MVCHEVTEISGCNGFAMIFLLDNIGMPYLNQQTVLLLAFTGMAYLH